MTASSENLIELPLSAFKPNDGVDYEPAFYDGLFNWIIDNKILAKIHHRGHEGARIILIRSFGLNTSFEHRFCDRVEVVVAIILVYNHLEGKDCLTLYPRSPSRNRHDVFFLVPEDKLPKQKSP